MLGCIDVGFHSGPWGRTVVSACGGFLRGAHSGRGVLEVWVYLCCYGVNV